MLCVWTVQTLTRLLIATNLLEDQTERVCSAIDHTAACQLGEEDFDQERGWDAAV